MKTINFKDLEWIVLEENNNTTKLLLKDVLDEERIKKYSNDDWYVDGYCVAHSDCARPPFDWDKSYIKNVILENFKKDLGIECECTLLTKEELEKLDSEIKQCNHSYWTRSNASDGDDHYAYAWYVYYYGYVGSVSRVNIATYFGVRPVVSLSSNLDLSEKVQKIEIDKNGYIHINNGSWKGRKLDIELVKIINDLLEREK